MDGLGWHSIYFFESELQTNTLECTKPRSGHKNREQTPKMYVTCKFILQFVYWRQWWFDPANIVNTPVQLECHFHESQFDWFVAACYLRWQVSVFPANDAATSCVVTTAEPAVVVGASRTHESQVVVPTWSVNATKDEQTVSPRIGNCVLHMYTWQMRVQMHMVVAMPMPQSQSESQSQSKSQVNMALHFVYPRPVVSQKR